MTGHEIITVTGLGLASTYALAAGLAGFTAATVAQATDEMPPLALRVAVATFCAVLAVACAALAGITTAGALS